jgi:hypothetical protein
MLVLFNLNQFTPSFTFTFWSYLWFWRNLLRLFFDLALKGFLFKLFLILLHNLFLFFYFLFFIPLSLWFNFQNLLIILRGNFWFCLIFLLIDDWSSLDRFQLGRRSGRALLEFDFNLTLFWCFGILNCRNFRRFWCRFFTFLRLYLFASFSLKYRHLSFRFFSFNLFNLNFDLLYLLLVFRYRIMLSQWRSTLASHFLCVCVCTRANGHNWISFY